MLTDYILILLLLYWGNTTPETEKTHHEPPVNAQAIVEEIDYCTLDVISCDDWQEGNFSAYNATVEQCGKSDGITASGKKVKEGRTLACPPEYEFGTQIEIEGMGTYTCEDRGGAIKGNKFDIYMEEVKDAKKFGRQILNFKIIE
jgi:3D (Asp-Asp-Asp) domain-containing protein